MTVHAIHSLTPERVDITDLFDPRRTYQSRVPHFAHVATRHGIVTAQSGMSVPDALAAADLDFTVSTEPIVAKAKVPGGLTVEVPIDFKKATVAVKEGATPRTLGVVGNRYTVCQNVEAFTLPQVLADEFDANVVAAAGYGDPRGSRSFVAVRADESFDLNGDAHEMFVLARNSHDGTEPLSAAIVPIRVASVSDVGIVPHASAPARWTIRHSGDLRNKAREAERTMLGVREWIATYRHVSLRMLAEAFTTADMTHLADRLLPTPKGATDRSALHYAQQRRALIELFATAPTSGFGRNSRYAAFQAVCEFVDHAASAKGADPAVVRAERAVKGRAGDTKQRAWNMLSADLA